MFIYRCADVPATTRAGAKIKQQQKKNYFVSHFSGRVITNNGVGEHSVVKIKIKYASFFFEK